MFNSPFLMQAATAIMLSGDSQIAPYIANRKEYVPWNPMFLEEGREVISYYIGVAFNVGITAFLGISVVYLLIKVLNNFSR